MTMQLHVLLVLQDGEQKRLKAASLQLMSPNRHLQLASATLQGEHRSSTCALKIAYCSRSIAGRADVHCLLSTAPLLHI